MKESLPTLAAMLVVFELAMWITPDCLKVTMEWILCAAVILWFLPNVFFA
jgi:hypothetical protein